jgi:hypothetical protein
VPPLVRGQVHGLIVFVANVAAAQPVAQAGDPRPWFTADNSWPICADRFRALCWRWRPTRPDDRSRGRCRRGVVHRHRADTGVGVERLPKPVHDQEGPNVKSQRLTRRRLMAITAAGAGAIRVAPSAFAGDGDTGGGKEHPFVDAVIAACRRHRIVAIGEIHGQQEHHDALQALLTDPRLPDVVDDIVVEFGNALYQPTIDRFAAGAAVEDRDLRLVWRNTTQSPVSTWDKEGSGFCSVIRPSTGPRLPRQTTCSLSRTGMATWYQWSDGRHWTRAAGR